MDPRGILALGIAAVAAVMLIIGALLRQRQILAGVLLPAAALIGALYIDEAAGNWLVIGLAILTSMMSGSLGVVLAVGVLAYAVAELVPGGWNAAIHVVIAIVCVSVVRSSVRHLVRIRRARALEPGQAPAHVVGLSGRVQGSIVAPPPGSNVRAAWWFIEAAPRWASSGQLRLLCDAGTVLVEPNDTTMALKLRHAVNEAPPAELEPLMPTPAADAGEPAPEAPASDEPVTYSLHWLEPDDEVYVVGKPEWGRAPADMAGYRDAPLVPVFRSDESFVSDGSAADVGRHAVFQLVAWTLWSMAVVAVVTAHLTAWI